MGPYLSRAAITARQHEARSEGAGGFARCWQLARIVEVDVCEIEVLWPGPLQWGYALAATADRLCSCGRRVCSGAVWHVSVGDVCAARGRRLLVELMMEAQSRGATDCLR